MGNSHHSATVPGVVIDHLPASSATYIGSPSIAVLSDGRYVASHDIFGPGSTYNHVRIFSSSDRGESWTRLCEIEGAFWSNLFVHRGGLYLMGTDGQYGSLVIRRSIDGGVTWTEPRDASTGLLRSDGRYHTAPMPMVEHGGRLWRACEDQFPDERWGKSFRAFVMSAPVDAELLDARSWRYTPPLAGNEGWLDGRFGGWLEGNAVLDPEGRIVDVLRVDYREGGHEKAAIVRVSDDGKSARFAESDFLDFPGGCKKFTIRRDPAASCYWTLANFVPERFWSHNAERARNTLALMRSEDLRRWEVRSLLLQHEDPEFHAFQYVDWLFEGDDIIVASRTAYDDGEGGAHNQHDANYMTFHRAAGFRELRDYEVGR